jgi:putative membrane protein
MVGTVPDLAHWLGKQQETVLPGGFRKTKRGDIVMRLTFALASAVALLSATAFAQSPSQAMAAAVGGRVSTADFVDLVAMSNMFDVRIDGLAAQKGDRSDKSFAQQEIIAHNRATQDLMTLVRNDHLNAVIPDTLDSYYRQKLDAIRKLSGQQFDNAYAKDQTESHRIEIAVVEQYARNGENPDLKYWAMTNLPELKEHLNRVERLA